MPEETTPPSDASEPSGDAGDDGARGGTSSDADTFAAERSALESKARGFQSEADKNAKELKAARDRIAELEKAGSTEDSTESDPPAALTIEQVQRAATEAALRANELVSAQATLRTEFPKADASIFNRLSEFGSVDALRSAVEASHSEAQDYESKVEERVRGEVLAEVAEKYGLDIGPPDPGDSTPTGDPTVEQLNAMTQAELDQLEKDKPGTIARVSGMPASYGGAWGS